MRDLSEDFVEETGFQGEKTKKGPLGYVKGALSSIF
jgi:hypothetical protein